jgi:hypothetical protein
VRPDTRARLCTRPSARKKTLASIVAPTHELYCFRAIDSTGRDSGGGIGLIERRAMIRGRRTWLGLSTI